MKKITAAVSVMLAFTMALGACGGGAAAPADNGGSNGPAEPAASAAAADSGEAAEEGPMYPIPGNKTLTILRTLSSAVAQGGYATFLETPILKSWQERTGVTVEISEPADDPALLLALSSGDVPDIIVGNKTLYPGGITKMNQDGFAIELTEQMLRDWAPDYYNVLLSDEQYMKSLLVDKKYHYAIGGYFMPIDSPFRTWRGILARKEYLDELGMETPRTPDELYDFLVGCRDQLGLSVPFTLRADMLRDGLNEGNFSSPFGLVNTSHYQIEGVYHYGAFEPEYKDVLTFLNKLYTEKLLDNNFPSNTDDTARAALINGDAALTVGNTSWISALTEAAEAPFSLVGIQSLVARRGDEPMFAQLDPVVTRSFWNYITEDCEDVETAMKFLNYMQTEEGRLLGNFGEEGVTFEYNAEGKPEYNDFVNANPNGYTRDQLMRVHGFIDWACIHLQEMSEQRFPMQAQRDVINTWFTADADKYTILNDAINEEFMNEYASLWTDIETYVNESRVRFITGEMPISEFDSYIQTLKDMGMERAIEILQTSYDSNN